MGEGRVMQYMQRPRRVGCRGGRPRGQREGGGGEGAERGKIDDKTKQKKRNKKGKTTKYTEMR